MRWLIATSNPHKLDEIRAVLRVPGVALIGLDDVGVEITEPHEDGDTFEANARLKARYYTEATGLTTIADDSGLAVDALGGEPGVRSARYSGATGERREVDLANNRLLLERLAETPIERRTARFVCAMAFEPVPDEPQGPALPPATTVRGTVEGRILTPAECVDPAHPERGRGAYGFGYDPLFLLPERGVTTAELPPSEKNRISHRGSAARRLAERLARHLAEGPPGS